MYREEKARHKKYPLAIKITAPDVRTTRVVNEDQEDFLKCGLFLCSATPNPIEDTHWADRPQ